MRKQVILGIFLAVSSAALAGSPQLYPTEDCNKATVQNDLNVCAGDNYAAADKALNETYRKLLVRQATAESTARLRSAQRVWIAYRDKECDSEVGPQKEGGSIWPMNMSICLEEKTAKRLHELTRQLDCSEGQNSCAQ
jgi:uncharacterized protein YecT (DUF1311 family)